jgi:hypothetical protein
VHCDPHAGNILVRKSKSGVDEIVLLDHGLYTVNTRCRKCRGPFLTLTPGANLSPMGEFSPLGPG